MRPLNQTATQPDPTFDPTAIPDVNNCVSRGVMNDTINLLLVHHCTNRQRESFNQIYPNWQNTSKNTYKKIMLHFEKTIGVGTKEGKFCLRGGCRGKIKNNKCTCCSTIVPQPNHTTPTKAHTPTPSPNFSRGDV
jgi:hypothetical protein